MKKIVCDACGTSPVNHNFLYLTNLFEGVLNQLGGRFIFSFSPKSKLIFNFTEKLFFSVLSILRIVKFNKDIEKVKTGRSRLIWEEAKRRGIPMEQVVLFGLHMESYRAKINSKFFYFESLPIPFWLSQEGYSWVDDKFILFKKLSSLNIPVPKTKKVFSLKEALKSFGELKKPIIIKPQSGSRGRHTTTNINTEAQLKKAYKLAKIITPFIVLQEHLVGSVCRATVIDGKLVGFFQADPPEVIGDGKKNISELIEKNNKELIEKVSAISLNNEMIDFIAREEFTLESVPKKEERVFLLAKTGRFYGGKTREIFPEVHPKMHDIFSHAGKVADAPVVGFDLIIQDPTKDPDTQRFGIIECNSLPFIDLHYFALEGKPIDLAPLIWDLWKLPANLKNRPLA
jgi:D-alanine-D-alanine ligase-like ATP-grasp enzyme